MSENYVALITGAASGIGYETSRQFIEQGATVIGVDINDESLQIAEKSLGSKFIPKLTDISDPDQIQTLFSDAEKQFGKLDALINNAGKLTLLKLIDLDADLFDKDISILLKAPMLLVKYFYPLLQKSANPSIVNIASIAGFQGVAGYGNYLMFFIFNLFF